MGCGASSSRVVPDTAPFEKKAQADTANEMQTVVEEFKEISAELRVEKMIVRTIKAILNLLPVERATVFVVDRDAGVLRTFNEMPIPKRNSSVREEDDDADDTDGEEVVFRQISVPLDTGIAGAAVRSCDKIIVADAQKDVRFNRSIDEKTGFHTRNILCVPVKLAVTVDWRKSTGADAETVDRIPGRAESSEVVAVLQALNHSSAFGPADVSVLEYIAMLLSGVLARSALVASAVRERSRATALLRVAETLSSAQPVALKAYHVMQAVKLGVDCERTAFFLVDEVRNRTYQQHAHAHAHANMRMRRLPLHALADAPFLTPAAAAAAAAAR